MKYSLSVLLLSFFFSLSPLAYSSPDQAKPSKASPAGQVDQAKKDSNNPPKASEAKTCKMEPEKKGSIFAVCKHCGCRMKFDPNDSDKMCTSCKCHAKNKECVMNKQAQK